MPQFIPWKIWRQGLPLKVEKRVSMIVAVELVTTNVALIPTGKELCNQIKQIKQHVTSFGSMLTELNSGQTCKDKYRGLANFHSWASVYACTRFSMGQYSRS